MNETKVFADAYDNIVVKLPPYQDAINKVSLLLEGRNNLLDLGCGTGELLSLLHSKNPNLRSVGVDILPEMTSLAKEKLWRYSSDIICGDAHKITLSKSFDAITSFNVLLNLSCPMKHLETAYKHLVPGGVFVLSSPKQIPDLVSAKNKFMNFLSSHPEKNNLENLAEVLFERQEGIANDFRNIYSLKEIKHILTNYMGFDNVLYEGDVYSNNFMIAVQKRNKVDSLDFLISRDVNDYSEGFKLRYHVLHDWHRAIAKSSDSMYYSGSDLNGFAGVIKERNTKKLVGFVNALPSLNSDIEVVDKKSYSYIQEKFPNHLYLNSFAVVPHLQKKGLGVLLAGKLFEHSLKQGFSAVVGEGNIHSAKVMQRFGGEIIGDDVFDKSKNVSSKMFYANLNSSKVQELIQHYNKKLDYLLN